MTIPIVFLDTETTSLADNRRPWEVAMIRVEPDSHDLIGTGTSFFISDVDIRDADPAALAIGRFYDRHPRFADPAGRPGDAVVVPHDIRAAVRSGTLRTEAQAALAVERITRGALVVGSNPGFDRNVLAPMLRRAGLVPSWHYSPTDVKTLALGYLHGRYAVGWGTDDMTAREVLDLRNAVIADAVGIEGVADTPGSSELLARAVGVPPCPESERHTAMGDARWVQRIYNAITTGRVIPAVPAALRPAGELVAEVLRGGAA